MIQDVHERCIPLKGHLEASSNYGLPGHVYGSKKASRDSECSWLSESIQKFRNSCLDCKCLDAGIGDVVRRKSCLAARKQDSSHE